MEQKNRLRLLNQFGYEADILDTYREPVNRSNQGALKTLGIITMLAGLIAIAYLLQKPSSRAGQVLSILVIISGAMGIHTGFMKQPKRTSILRSTYLIFFFLYAIAIYGTVARQTDAFWIGIQMGLCCYVLDYAWHVISLQLLSYASILLVWQGAVGQLSGSRLLFLTIFLLAGIVTFYTLSRARLSLIMSREESRQQADTDLLTGLTIRNAAQEEIEKRLEREEENGVLILLDLDRFKSVNDRLGHQKGDQVLIDVAADLRKMFRNSDVLSRLGGDEFIIYMQGVPEEEWAMQRAEQVVREIRRWVGDGTTNVQISASVGVVMTGTVDRNYTDMYRAADIAMYFAKAQGGNRAVLYTQELIDRARSSGSMMSGGAEARTVAEQNQYREELR